MTEAADVGGIVVFGLVLKAASEAIRNKDVERDVLNAPSGSTWNCINDNVFQNSNAKETRHTRHP